MKMSAKLFSISIVLLFFCLFFSEKVFPGWFKHYGGSNHDNGRSIQQTSDGGYIVTGYTYSFSYGSDDFAIYRLNSNGNKVWFKHYGGNNADQGHSIQQTTDGGYIVAGYTETYTNGNQDFAIYKLDSSGNKVWFKHYGGAVYDSAYSIQQTSDGGYIVAGNTHSYTHGGADFAIYKLDSSGNKVWFKHYGGANNDHANCIQQTSEGGYIVAGYTYSFSYGSDDFAIYKLDSDGNKVWFKHYGGTSSERGNFIQQTSDGGYIVTGYTESYSHGQADFGIFRLNSSGNKTWFKHYGGSTYDYGQSIRQTSDGGYIVAGATDSYTHGSYDFAIYKLNSSGNKAWFKHYGGTAEDWGVSVQQVSDGGYIVAGHTTSYSYGNADFGVYKLDSNGDK